MNKTKFRSPRKEISNVYQFNRNQSINVISSLIEELYGDSICKKVSYKKIYLYISPSRASDYINTIVERLAGSINDESFFCENEEDVSIVFDDGNKRPCEWKIKDLNDLIKLVGVNDSRKN